MFYDMYYKEIKKLDSEQWEYFAQDFFYSQGYRIERPPSRGADRGVDLILLKDNIRYLVSCKHFISSDTAVSKRHENDIRDRLERNLCTGFIGFYSTSITSDFQEYLNTIIYKYIFTYNEIIMNIPKLPHHILQKYFHRPYEISFWKNVSSYIPLDCQVCEKDILLKENIHYSCICLYIKKNELYLMHGCKSCINNYVGQDIWAELHQLRFQEELLNWNSLLCEKLHEYKPHPTFYRSYYLLQRSLQQIMIPQGWGTWH